MALWGKSIPRRGEQTVQRLEAAACLPYLRSSTGGLESREMRWLEQGEQGGKQGDGIRKAAGGQILPSRAIVRTLAFTPSDMGSL